MSTSMLYHGWSVHGYQYVRTEYENGRIVYVIRQEDGDLRCPSCGSGKVFCSGQFVSKFKTLPIGLKPVILRLPVQRVECRDCGAIRQVKVAFADERREAIRTPSSDAPLNCAAR